MCLCTDFPDLDLDFLDEVDFLVIGFVSCEPAIFVWVCMIVVRDAKKNMKKMKNTNEEMKNVCREYVGE